MAPVRRSRRTTPHSNQHQPKVTSTNKPTTTAKPPPKPKSKPIKSSTLPPHLQSLQHSLAITPKTTLLLARAFSSTHPLLSYCDLATESPNSILHRLKASGVAAKEAEWFRRPLRRMVWLGTFEESETKEKAAKTAEPQFWTVRHLREMGVWVEGYDGMSGWEVRRVLDGKGV